MHFSFKGIKEKAIQLLHENTTPDQIALGSAIGVFVGLTPFFGLHTLIVILIAIVVKRANKIAMLLGIQITIAPLVPLIYYFEFKIGKFFLLLDDHYNERFYDDDLSLYAKFNLKFFATLVGSLIVGIICALVSYFVIRFLIIKYRQKISSAL